MIRRPPRSTLFPYTRSSDLDAASAQVVLKDSIRIVEIADDQIKTCEIICEFRGQLRVFREEAGERSVFDRANRSEEHTSELQSPCNLVCRLLLEKKKK